MPKQPNWEEIEKAWALYTDTEAELREANNLVAKKMGELAAAQTAESLVRVRLTQAHMALRLLTGETNLKAAETAANIPDLDPRFKDHIIIIDPEKLNRHNAEAKKKHRPNQLLRAYAPSPMEFYVGNKKLNLNNPDRRVVVNIFINNPGKWIAPRFIKDCGLYAPDKTPASRHARLPQMLNDCRDVGLIENNGEKAGAIRYRLKSNVEINHDKSVVDPEYLTPVRARQLAEDFIYNRGAKPPVSDRTISLIDRLAKEIQERKDLPPGWRERLRELNVDVATYRRKH